MCSRLDQVLINSFQIIPENEIFLFFPAHSWNNNLGISRGIYTQFSDVEIECNGLVTYDRKLIKVDTARMKATNKGKN
jgi:hypothetical protein